MEIPVCAASPAPDWLIQALNFVADSVRIPLIISALIGLPSAFVYFLQLFLIVRHWRQFRSSFFALFALRAVLALLNQFFSCWSDRFPRLGWFWPLYSAFPTPLLSIFYFFKYFPFHAENLVNFFMLLNRFTSIAMSTSYERLWRWATPLAILVTFCLPLPITIQILLDYKVYLHSDRADNSYFQLWYDLPVAAQRICYKWQFMGNTFFGLVSSLIFMAICVLLNLVTLFVYRKKTNGVASNESDQLAAERKLTVYVIVTLLGQMIMSLYMASTWFVSIQIRCVLDALNIYSVVTNCVNNQGPWVSDLCTVAIPAWLMLWASQKMRQAFLDFFKAFPISNYWKNKNNVITMSSKTNKGNLKPETIEAWK